MHQLRERAPAVLLQPARVQVRAGGVPARGHPLDRHRLLRQHGLPAAHRGQARRPAVSAGRPVQVSLLLLTMAIASFVVLGITWYNTHHVKRTLKETGGSMFAHR